MLRAIVTIVVCGGLAALSASCGSSGASRSTSRSQGTESPSTGSTSGVGALSAEASSAATGDIPDNQVFLTYRNPVGHYSLSYPEGWAIKVRGADVTFADKNNIVHVVASPGGPPTTASVAAELTGLKRSNPTLTFTPPTAIHVKPGSAIKSTYTTRSAQNPVTGKSVLLVVDRYELSNAGKRATVDLGTPKGVDNVDAYRMMINSFRWR